MDNKSCFEMVKLCVFFSCLLISQIIASTNELWIVKCCGWLYQNAIKTLFILSYLINIKDPRHWPLCGKFTGDRWIPRTKGQQRGKCFPFDDVIIIPHHLRPHHHPHPTEDVKAWWRRHRHAFPIIDSLWGNHNHTVTGGFSSTRANNAELWGFIWC